MSKLTSCETIDTFKSFRVVAKNATTRSRKAYMI